MSRGGGRFGKKNPNFLLGATWEQDPNQKVETKPSELFPPVPDLPTPRPLTLDEKRVVENNKQLREAIHRGPLYTESRKPDPFESKRVYGEEQRNAQYRSAVNVDIDPFEQGVPTYSAKFHVQKRTVPDLKHFPFIKEFFPPELHETIDGKATRKVGSKKEVTADVRKRRVEENLNGIEEGEDEGEKVVEEDEEVVEEEEEQDDAFDDEEMGGDYDAEQYFDDGERDEDDIDGGGEEYY